MDGKGRYVLIVLGAVLLGLILWYFSSIITYILISLVLSFIGRPVVDLLNKIKIKNWKVPSALSAGISLLLLWFVMVLFFRTFIPLFASEAKELSKIDVQAATQSLSEPIRKLEAFASRFASEG